MYDTIPNMKIFTECIIKQKLYLVFRILLKSFWHIFLSPEEPLACLTSFPCSTIDVAAWRQLEWQSFWYKNSKSHKDFLWRPGATKRWRCISLNQKSFKCIKRTKHWNRQAWFPGFVRKASVKYGDAIFSAFSFSVRVFFPNRTAVSAPPASGFRGRAV